MAKKAKRYAVLFRKTVGSDGSKFYTFEAVDVVEVEVKNISIIDEKGKEIIEKNYTRLDTGESLPPLNDPTSDFCIDFDITENKLMKLAPGLTLGQAKETYLNSCKHMVTKFERRSLGQLYAFLNMGNIDTSKVNEDTIKIFYISCFTAISNFNDKDMRDEMYDVVLYFANVLKFIKDQLDLISYDNKEYNEHFKKMYDELSKINYNDTSEQIYDAIETFFYNHEDKLDSYAAIIDEFINGPKEKKELAALESKDSSKNNPRDFEKIKAYLDERVVGQDKVKRKIIVAIHNNITCPNKNSKRSIILMGPSGSGKTHLVTTLGEALDLPVYVYNASNLTPAGYIGDPIEKPLEKLLEAAKGDIEKAQKGVLYFDEIDKRTTSEKTGGNVGEFGEKSIEQLLNFISGAEYNVKFGGKLYNFKTDQLTVIVGGSFAKMVAKMQNQESGDYKGTKIGFTANLEKKDKNEQDIVYPKKITSKDLSEKAGMPIELANRCTVACLDGHTRGSLRELLCYNQSSPMLAFSEKLKKEGIELFVMEDFIDEAVEEAFNRKQGGRSLNNLLTDMLSEIEYPVFAESTHTRVLYLTKESVLDPNKAVVIDSNNNVRTVGEINDELQKAIDSKPKQMIFNTCKEIPNL